MISEKPSEAEVRKKIKTRLINRGPRTKQKTMLTALWIGEHQFFFLSFIYCDNDIYLLNLIFLVIQLCILLSYAKENKLLLKTFMILI